jgi:iron complex outermembrane receptor protein
MMKLELKSFLVLTLCLLLSSFLYSQRQISGVVKDASSGEPLIGVNILVVGTSTGTVSDIDGSYAVDVPAGATQLQFSYTGYTSVTITIGNESVRDVLMSAGAILEEVVVIGYGTVKKQDATGSVQTVSSKDFNKGSITSATELLSGKIAGVSVTTGGSPGGGSVIRIRGGSSLSATNDPLIVIDGIPVANDGISGSRNTLNILNPNDIETFTVLKDASATAIYGSRASNGVIMITTKKGSLKQKIGVDYNGNVSFSNITKKIEVPTADEYKLLINSRFPAGHQARTLLGNSDTDWQEEIFQTGIAHDHNLSISGGVGNVPYRVSFGFNDKDGVLKTDNFNRKTLSLNLAPGLLDNYLQINVNMKGMIDKNHFANQNAIGAATFFDPTQPVLTGDSKFGGYFTWKQANGDPLTLAPANPLALLNLRDDESTVKRYIINASADYRFHFLPDLRANLNVGYDKSESEGNVFIPATASFAFTDKGRKSSYSQEKKNEIIEYYMNYVKKLGKTKLDLMAGYSWQHFWAQDTSSAPTSADEKTVLGPGSRYPRENFLVSLFGRLNYTLYDRYLLTLTLRRDGTSRFSPDTRWGMFPAAALAVKVIEKESGTLSNLKLRVGYGVTGQQDIGGDLYPYLARYQLSTTTAQYQFGNEFIQTLRPAGYDANIKWEETATYNIAADFGLFSSRLNGTVEVYQRKTKDLINFIPVPAGTNLTNYINTNVGDLENKGIELSLNMNPVRTTKANWDIGFNASYNKNEITKLTAIDDPNYLGVLTGGIAGGVGNNIKIHSVGYPANSYFVYEQVYDANKLPIEGLYVDKNGDGVVTPADRYRHKKASPDFFMGFTSNFNYGNFDFSFAARANIGNYIYNNNLSDKTSYNNLFVSSGFLNNVLRSYADVDFVVPQYFSDHFIQNGSFLRFDHITAGYNFTDLFEKIKSIRLYATVQNPILITKYSGIDPEIFSGIDNNIYPRSRTFLIGLNANF